MRIGPYWHGSGADESINLAIRNQARRDDFEKGVFLGPVIDECW